MVWSLMVFIQGTIGGSIDSGSVLDFMSMKSYPDMSLDMLNTLGKIMMQNCTCVLCVCDTLVL